MSSRLRERLERSFLERNQRVIGMAAILLVLAGTAVALLLSGGVFARTYPVRVHLRDAGGITAGDKVTVAGLEAGRVKGMTIRRGVVVMELAVNRGVELPADTRAEVVLETLLGKRSVNLVAGGETGRALEDVGVIPVQRTTTPVDITELNDISVRLLNRSDADAFNDLLEEVAEVTEGQREEVGEIVTGLADVLEAVDSRRSQLKSLVASLRKLSTTLGTRDRTIVSLIDNLDPVLANLAERQEDLRRLLVSTAGASQETASLVRRNRGVLDTTLASLHEVLQVLDRHQLDLAAGIAYLEDSIQGYQSVGYSQGTCGRHEPPCEGGVPNRWANIFVQSLGALGIDTFLGRCGAIDQIIDQALGLDCEESSPPPDGTSTDGAWDGDDTGPPGLDDPLPGDVGDLVGSVLEGTGGLR